MIDLKLYHVRPRRFYSTNFNFTLAKASLNDSNKLSSTQQKLAETPLTGKIALVLFIIALVTIQLV